MARVALASFATLALLSPSRAATLRPFGTLAGPTVTVSDLWDDAGAVAEVVLGPSPAPGERITVEAPQLAAIARQFGVAWTPPSTAMRSILERPGLPLPQELVDAALLVWLDHVGAPTGAIELDGFATPLIAPNAATHVAVEHGEWDAASSRFNASLVATGRAMSPLRLRATGRVVAMAPALMAVRRLPTGTILTDADVRVGDLPRERLHREAATLPTQAQGRVLRHPVTPGEPIMLDDLGPPRLVARGARIVITIDAVGVALSAIGEAMQAGALGERIAVRNPASRAVLLAEVIGPDAVRVMPGSAPVSRPVSGAGHGDGEGATP